MRLQFSYLLPCDGDYAGEEREADPESNDTERGPVTAACSECGNGCSGEKQHGKNQCANGVFSVHNQYALVIVGAKLIKKMANEVTFRIKIVTDGEEGVRTVTMDAEELDRVVQEVSEEQEEVVDYIIDAGLYCILNVHHDTGGSDVAWLRAWQDEEYLENVEHKFCGLWTNIANEFNSYGDKLLFESYNEMLDGNLSWTETDDKGYAALNRLAQSFVTTVRATGGNNAHRNLIVNTYSADAHERTLAAFVVPTAPIANHIIVEVHNYTPGEFVSPETEADAKSWNSSFAAELDESFLLIDKYLTSRGIPVLIGEFGCNDKVPEDEQVKYAEYFLAKAQPLGVPAFHWFDLINRNTLQWRFPEVKNVLVR